jgi:hypothetical protein
LSHEKIFGALDNDKIALPKQCLSSEVGQDLRNDRPHGVSVAAVVNHLVKGRKCQKRNANNAHHDSIVAGCR